MLLVAARVDPVVIRRRRLTRQTIAGLDMCPSDLPSCNYSLPRSWRRKTQIRPLIRLM